MKNYRKSRKIKQIGDFKNNESKIRAVRALTVKVQILRKNCKKKII